MTPDIETTYPFHPRVGDQLDRRTGRVRPDGRRHIPYVYSDDIVIAVNAALATRRPLLLRGEPGSGKSTLARDVAYALDREFAEKVVTSHTTANDLLWEFDAVERLSNASQPELVKDRARYVRPGVLWSAFAPRNPTPQGAVVLIDEIDKADPDVPNDLLIPLGEDRFVVTETEELVTRTRDVLVVITTNGERELPPAFLRRCVALTLDDPSKVPATLAVIAERHLSAMREDEGLPERPLDPTLLPEIVARIARLTADLAPTTRKPGTAEILDAFKACIKLGITPGSQEWKTVTRVLLYKEPGKNPDAPAAPPGVP